MLVEFPLIGGLLLLFDSAFLAFHNKAASYGFKSFSGTSAICIGIAWLTSRVSKSDFD